MALYLAVVSIVTGSLLVLTALQLADARIRAARQWSVTAELAARLASLEHSGMAPDSMEIDGIAVATDSGTNGWIRDRVQRLDDSVFSRLMELGAAGAGVGSGARRSGRLATWCPSGDSVAGGRTLCPLSDGRFGPP